MRKNNRLWRSLLPAALFTALFTSGLTTGRVASATPAPYPGGVHWVSMPVRNTAQAALGMNGGEGGQCILGMTRCASDDNRLYIDIDVCGVWRSDNGGAFWHPCRMAGLNNNGSSAVAVSPTNHDVVLVYSEKNWQVNRAGFEGIYRSTDGGDTWNRTLTVRNNDGAASRAVLAFASNGTRVYAGSYNSGMFRSDDGGATWTAALSLVGTIINRVAVDPSSPNKVWAATSAGLQVSTDSGVTWALKSAAVNVTDVSPDSITANRIYYILPNTGLYRSNDGGATWTFVSCGNAGIDTGAKRLFQSPIDSLHIILTNGSASRVTTDGGATWQDFSVDTSKTYNTPNGWNLEGGTCWSYTNASSVVGTNACLPYASTDGGVHWGDSGTGFTGFWHQWSQTSVAFAATDPNRIATFCDDMNASVTLDNGNTWITKKLAAQVEGWWGAYAGDMSPNWATTPLIISASGNYFRDDLMRSTTGTSNTPDWTDVSASNSDHKFVRFNQQSPNIVYADNQRSTDAGLTWGNLTYNIRGMAPSNCNIVYAYNGANVMKSTDTGTTWTTVTPAPSVAPPSSAMIIGVDPVNTSKIWIISGNDIAMFNGTAWTSYPVSSWVSSGLSPVVDRLAVDPTNGNKVVVGLDTSGTSYLFYTNDGGTTWYDITGDAPELGFGQSLNIQPVTGRIFIGMAFGTYTTVIGTSPGGDVTAPTAPTNLASPSQTSSTVNLTWTASTDNVAVRSYDVYNGSYLVASTPVASYTVCGLTANTYTFKVVARDNAGNQTSSSPLVVTIGAAPTAIPQTATPPVIDGAVDAVWSGSASHAINNISGTVSSSADLSGSWQALWDTTNLYLLVTVTDDVLKQFVTNPWEGDSVEVYLDADNSRNTSYDANDFQYEFPWNSATIVEPKHNAITGVALGQANITGGYRIEVKIPWSTLGVTAAVNNPIGLDVHINDCDVTAGTRDGKRMWNDTTDMAWSNPNLFGTGQLTGASVLPPPAPTGLTATAGNTQVALSWTASTGATSYNVSRSTVSGSGYASVTTGVAATSYTNTGLTNGTAYYFVVSATNSGGTSGNSGQASATPVAPSGGNTHSGTWALQGIIQTAQTWGNTWQIPGGVAANQTYTASFWMKGSGAMVMAVDAGNWGAELKRQTFTATSTWTQYSFTIPTGTNTQLTLIFTDAAGVAGTLYIDDCFLGVLNGTNILAVPGFEGGTGWNTTAPWTILQPGGSAPAAPTGLTATAGDSQVALSWTASTGATSYNVKRSTVNGSGYATVASPTTTSYTNTGLTNGTAYYYVVTAVNTGGESVNSTQASATPAAGNTHSGTWALKGVITATASFKNAWQAPSVAASSSYTASFWMKGPGGIKLVALNGAWGTQNAAQTFTSASSSWQQYSMAVSTGANTQMTFLLTDTSGSAGTIYIDDCFFGILNGTNVLGNPGFESGATSWNLDTPPPFTIVQNP